VEITRVTDNAIFDVLASFLSDGVVWLGMDRGPGAGTDLEIFYSAFDPPIPVPGFGFAGRSILCLTLLAVGAFGRRGGHPGSPTSNANPLLGQRR
jgi:hypothetical protein